MIFARITCTGFFRMDNGGLCIIEEFVRSGVVSFGGSVCVLFFPSGVERIMRP